MGHGRHGMHRAITAAGSLPEMPWPARPTTRYGTDVFAFHIALFLGEAGEVVGPFSLAVLVLVPGGREGDDVGEVEGIWGSGSCITLDFVSSCLYPVCLSVCAWVRKARHAVRAVADTHSSASALLITSLPPSRPGCRQGRSAVPESLPAGLDPRQATAPSSRRPANAPITLGCRRR